MLAAEHELGPALLAGWTAAAIRQRRADWARLLVDETEDPALVAVLGQEDVERLALRLATADGVLTALGLATLEALRRPWPEALGPRVGEAVDALFLERRLGRHHVPSLRRLARALDPPVLLPLAGALSAAGPAASAGRAAGRPGCQAAVPRRDVGGADGMTKGNEAGANGGDRHGERTCPAAARRGGVRGTSWTRWPAPTTTRGLRSGGCRRGPS